MSAHPLMEIQFDFDIHNTLLADRVIRFWYHVPRIGDWIDLGKQAPHPDGGEVWLSGRVTDTVWTEEHVYVRVKHD